MEKEIHLAYLFDFYGDLLKPEQKEIFYSFVFDDLSLQEIANEFGISRQAVHDRVTRCIHSMEDYESKLHLIEKYQRMEAACTDIKEQIREVLPDDSSAVTEIEGALDAMLEVL